MKYTKEIGLAMLLVTTSSIAVVPVEEAHGSQVQTDGVPVQHYQSAQAAKARIDGTTSAVNAATRSRDSAFLLGKIDVLQQELQQLRGQLEVQTHDLKLLQQQLQAFYKDLDKRVVSIGQQSQPAAVKHKAVSKKSIQETSEESVSTSASAQADYKAAYELVRQREFSRAITAMHEFLKNHPKSQYVANAHYWLGELYLVSGPVESAVKHLQIVVKNYPESSKAAAAMLKLGFAFYDEGHLKQAQEQLTRLTKRFPDTSSARLAVKRLQIIEQEMARG